jgi:TRAP-type uncharacterized transport system substrate-binding protein
MNKIIIAGIVSFIALVGCSAPNNISATPTVTVTALPPEPAEDQYISNKDRFIDFVRSNGGYYGEAADTSDILDIGNTICSAYNSGISKDDVIKALAESLMKNNMNNEAGTQFAAALLFGAEKYLCNGDL